MTPVYWVGCQIVLQRGALRFASVETDWALCERYPNATCPSLLWRLSSKRLTRLHCSLFARWICAAPSPKATRIHLCAVQKKATGLLNSSMKFSGFVSVQKSKGYLWSKFVSQILKYNHSVYIKLLDCLNTFNYDIFGDRRSKCWILPENFTFFSAGRSKCVSG